MSKPSREPQQVKADGTVWYYEDKRTLHFFVECRDKNGIYTHVESFRVPISKLLKSIKRCYDNPRKVATNAD